MEDAARENEIMNAILQRVPTDTVIGNKTLFTYLNQKFQNFTWDEYWIIRNKLIDEGKLERRRGKGGSVIQIKVAPHVGEPPVPGDVSPIVEQRERDLYEPMRKVIEEAWARESGYDDVVVAITALGGRTGDGRWSRPDITLASVRIYQYVPGKTLDIVTFEVKTTSYIDITCVYEALAHRRASTKSYVLLYVPEDQRESREQVLSDIQSECKKHGIGMIVAADPADFDAWDEVVEAELHQPDPRDLNKFIAGQSSENLRRRLGNWIR